ncbi:MAG: tRNA uridine-5-carboxymethylaminomethyl(34) synthesis GTPase MnmE [Clostridia bacterium]|nr:tRNA uridine-5-carboxymethylaminomethyl(34) synthesis GTPase MnmE [Clostridia bacterium]
MYTDRTVAAISTPMGRGGIAVIRISGADAVSVSEKVFRPFGKKKLSEVGANSAVYGAIYDGSERIDDGIATVFYAPRSYTGEDTVEISCHGGILLSRRVLSAVYAAGADAAGPGEFTRRAFVNGKLSLTEAEAVIGLINAESDAQLKIFASHTKGTLSKKIDKISESLTALLASVYAYIDYPDEDMTDVGVDEMVSLLKKTESDLITLEKSYKTGHAVTEGIPTVIAGKPNTGKSSLLNMLLGRDRAIVTDIAGTTRDTIEENAYVGPVMLRLCDTAGLHETTDTVERMGVERSEMMLKNAQLVLAVFDGSSPLDQADRDFLDLIAPMSCPKIALINKSDKGRIVTDGELAPFVDTIIPICCQNGEGKEALEKVIVELFTDGDIENNFEGIVANARQYAFIKNARENVSAALVSLSESMTQDIAGMDIELAISALRDADSRRTSGEIVDEIFKNFCVGK